MLFLARRIRRDFTTWERPVQLSFVIGLLLLGVLLVLLFLAPQEQRMTLLIGFGTLMLVTQLIVLWGNRRMVTPLTRAQRAFMAEDFLKVLAELEPLHASGKADFRVLTLLGNAYRQVGRLDDSLRVLSEAVDKSENHHYSLYALGRTLLVRGQFEEGAAWIEQAVAAGAPNIVCLDLAEAYLRAEQSERARHLLNEIAAAEEPHRALALAYWRYRVGLGKFPDRTQILAGLAYWQAQAERFAATPYGKAVADDVNALQAKI
jgi:tetratricopeptide (TPR) repeat protein